MGPQKTATGLFIAKFLLASGPHTSTPTKKLSYVVSTSASIFFILYVKPIRSLLIQHTVSGIIVPVVCLNVL